MKGLELEFKNKKTSAAIRKGVLTIITSINTVNEKTEAYVDFKGLCFEKDSKEHLTWADISLQVGDTITIKVVDVDQISPTIKHIEE